VKLTIDHVVPEALGGRDEPENLVTACMPCNSGKSSIAPDSPIVADVRQDAVRWKRAMELARQGDVAEREEKYQRREDFLELWNRWTYRKGIKDIPFSLPTDWIFAVDALADAGLDLDDMNDAILETMPRSYVDDRFRYFCGVAWNMVKDRQERARVLAPYMDGSDA
jgi:hypothetical protein